MVDLSSSQNVKVYSNPWDIQFQLLLAGLMGSFSVFPTFSAAPQAALGAANAATAFRSVSCSNFCRNAKVAVEVGEMANAWENVSWIFFNIRILQGFTLISLILLTICKKFWWKHPETWVERMQNQSTIFQNSVKVWISSLWKKNNGQGEVAVLCLGCNCWNLEPPRLPRAPLPPLSRVAVVPLGHGCVQPFGFQFCGLRVLPNLGFGTKKKPNGCSIQDGSPKIAFSWTIKWFSGLTTMWGPHSVAFSWCT